MSKESDGTVRSELTLARVSWKDEGTYTCMAREVTNNEEKTDTPTKQEVLLEVYGKNKKIVFLKNHIKKNQSLRHLTQILCKYRYSRS